MLVSEFDDVDADAADAVFLAASAAVCLHVDAHGDAGVVVCDGCGREFADDQALMAATDVAFHVVIAGARQVW